jgi:hypothetical protein
VKRNLTLSQQKLPGGFLMTLLTQRDSSSPLAPERCSLIGHEARGDRMSGA